jgi:hypothetical protein
VEKSGIFAVGGWDGKFRLYEIVSDRSSYSSKHMFSMIFGFEVNEPIICMCWISQDQILLGLSSGEICILSIKNNSIDSIYKCSAPVIGIYAYTIEDRSNSITVLVIVDLSSAVYLLDLHDFK